jgi:hypothetical protein
MEISKDPTRDTKVQEVAKEFICQYITGTLKPINYLTIFHWLNCHLPGLDVIANVFFNAPALTPGVFEKYHGSNLHCIAGAPRPPGLLLAQLAKLLPVPQPAR